MSKHSVIHRAHPCTYNIAVGNNFRKSEKRKLQKPEAWIKQRIHDIDIGEISDWNDKPHPEHKNTHARLVIFYDQRRRFANGQGLATNEKKLILDRFTQAKFDLHAAGETTLYFSGSKDKQPFTLAMIDPDNKNGVGTKIEAQRCLEFLKSNQCRQKYGLNFPELYVEDSTSGNSCHGFFVVDKQNLTSIRINDGLRNLSKWLKLVVYHEGFGIGSMDNVKGTCPIFTWGVEKHHLLNVQAGVFGKIPRGFASRAFELQNTAVIQGPYLNSVEFLRNISFHRPAQLPKIASRTVLDASASKIPLRIVEPVKTKCGGSVEGIKREQILACLAGRYRDAASSLCDGIKRTTQSRKVVSDLDIAVFLMLLEFFTNHMNDDGSLPTNRFRKLQDCLLEHGMPKFDNEKYKVIRDHFSDLGLLDWEDRRYRVKTQYQDG